MSRKDMISIIIPTYNDQGEMHNDGYNNLTMLNDLLESISTQTYKNIEVIISDHSKDDLVKELCEKYGSKMLIRYFKFCEKYGSMEANFNNAVSKAEGEFIKPMFQDDYFFRDDALEIFHNHMTDDVKWVISGCIHIKENEKNYFTPMSPIINDYTAMLTGNNLIGSPIVCLIRGKEYFDENLIWLTDVELYVRLLKEYGNPAIIEEQLMVSRLRQDGIANTRVFEELREDEKKYCIEKYLGNEHNLENYVHMSARVLEFINSK